MRISDTKIVYRLLAMVAIGALALAGFGVVSLSNLYSTLVAEREAKIKEHVEAAQTLIRGIEKNVAQSGRPVAEAQRAALDALRAMRFGGGQYFWVNDMSGTMLMHPTNLELVGTSVMDIRDFSTGKRIFGDMIDVVRKNGGGFYRYMWKVPSESHPRPKVSYVAGIPEWNWVVGSGTYIDDVDALFWQQARRLVGIGIAGLALGVVVCLAITRGVVKPLSVVAAQMKELALGRLDIPIAGVDRGDEIGAMARALRAVQCNLAATAGIADEIAQGNLTVGIQPVSEWDRLGMALKTMLAHLSNLVADSTGAAKAVHRGAATIAESVQNLSATSSELSASVAEITSTMEELSASSSQISEHSGSVAEIANQTWESSKKGADAMELLSSKMASIQDENQHSLKEIIGLGKTSKEISKIMTIINGIADQTKLIAFNAALEAASAGEAGKRFGVVAAEIRRLADGVTESTGEIESKISQIQDSISRLVITSEKGASSVVDGMAAATNTARHLDELVDAASKTASAAQQISLSTQQQKTAANQVVVALREIVGASHHTAQSMAQLSDVSRNLAELSSDLDSRVNRFRLTSAPASANAAAAAAGAI